MQACFIGHRTIEKNEKLILLLRQTIIDLINKGVETFLFGSMSEFDDLALKIVTEIKVAHPFIKRVYVRASYQYVDKEYEEYLLKFYEETYFPLTIKNAGKVSYIKRNYEMIKNSTYCIFYYNENYVPQLRKKSKPNAILTKPRNSGTKLAYRYALKMNKTIINLYNAT